MSSLNLMSLPLSDEYPQEKLCSADSIVRSTLLVSSHTKGRAGQFYTYWSDNKRATISDDFGRKLDLTWEGDSVASITGATASVRYNYDMVKANDDSLIAGTERLETVEFLAAAEDAPTTRRYHYEDLNYRHLLTGITDERGARFATYAYNDSGQAVLSEHAGGVNRFTFAYPEKEKRFITNPLGTQQEIALTCSQNTAQYVKLL